MTTIHALEQQLTTFETRREALTAELNEATLARAAARAAVVEGTRDATRRVTEQQATATALEEALATLDRRIGDTRTALTAARQAAEREAWVQRLADLAQQATTADDAYQAALAEANEVLIPCIDRMLRAYEQQAAARTAFLQAARFSQHSVGEQRALIDEIECEYGVSLDALLVPLVGTSSTQHDRRGARAEVKPYGRHIAGILVTILQQREQERERVEKLERARVRDQREWDRAAANQARLAALEEAARQEAEQRAQQEAEERAQAQAYWDSIYRAW